MKKPSKLCPLNTHSRKLLAALVNVLVTLALANTCFAHECRYARKCAPQNAH